MVKRLSSELLVTPSDFQPTRDDFEIIGVFNPGAARLGDEIVLLVRVAQACTRREDGWVHSPRSVVISHGRRAAGGAGPLGRPHSRSGAFARAGSERGEAEDSLRGRAASSRKDGRIRYEIDRLQIHPDDDGDYRKPLTVLGRRRLAFISHLELVRVAADGHTVKEVVRLDALFGRTEWEEYGVEDARITKIGDTYHITYVSVSSKMGVATSLMTTRDFEEFRRLGVIFPCENKDVVLFPEKVDGMYWAFHRPVGHIAIRPLAILAASSPDLVHWGGHEYVLGCSSSSGGSPGWYSKRIGAGTPPVKTPEGWLSIFHGVRERHPGDVIGEYTAGAMLTALEEPARLVALSDEPFFRAEEDHEVSGYVKNVVFPTGAVTDTEDPDRLHVYYGCADSSVAVATFSISEVLASLRHL